MSGWKTVAFFGTVAVLGAIEALTGAVGFADSVGPGVMSAIGAVGVILRALTSTPIFQSVPPKT